jgi:putative oxidoreductase
MNAFLSLGRWLFAIPFAIFGLFHFMNAEGMAGMVPDYMPAKSVLVYLSGAGLIAASVSMVTGKYDKLATTLLAIFLLMMVGLMHLQGAMSNNAASMSMLLKDISLAGAAMMYAYNYATDRSIIG